MKKTLMMGFLLIILCALVVTSVLNALAFNSKSLEDAKNEMHSYAKLISESFEPNKDADEQAKHYAALSGNIRVTVISPEGVVLGDSRADYRTMHNHISAPEIVRAGALGSGSSIRSSSTIGKKFVYSAIKRNDGIFIRVAAEADGISGIVFSTIPTLFAVIFVVFILAVYFASRFSSHFVNPIIKMSDSIIAVKYGGVQLNPESYSYTELGEIAVKVNSIAKELSAHIDTIRQEKDKLNYILDNVGEGFLLLGENQDILLINRMACSYLKCDKSVVSQNLVYAFRNYDFLQSVQTVISGGTCKGPDIETDGRVIETHFIRLAEDSGFSAALIVTMTDVTETRRAVRIRREFFSNASHELKTPITSIRGSAELLCADLPVSEAQQRELLARIGIESERLCMLINDVIMINRMESGDISGDFDHLHLKTLVNDCIEEVRPIAETQHLNIFAELEQVTMHADKKNMRELFSNLIVNAVKYNTSGGRVEIDLRQTDDEVIFTVRNDGDPIPPEHQHRVFERFYRVDSGRSRTVGGTGLGLSIVKHIAESMSGTVSLTSTEANGTRFTVRLPKK